MKRLTYDAIGSSEQIMEWVRQFGESDRNIALSLLLQLRFVSYQDFRDWFWRSLQLIPLDRPTALYAVRELDHENLWDGEEKIVPRSGRSMGSEDLVYSLIGQACRRYQSLFHDHPSIPTLLNQRVRTIALIDDSIGSGDRISKFIRAFFSSKKLKSWWSYGLIHIAIITYARVRESEWSVMASIPGSDHGLRKYRKSSKATFYSQIEIGKYGLLSRWGEGYERILELCDGITAISGDVRRGYGDVMSNIVFYHSVPNNVPGILWSQRRNVWKPLFPKRAVPEWFQNLLSQQWTGEHGRQETSVSPQIIGLLNCVKCRLRSPETIAIRLDCDINLVMSLITKSKESGLLDESNRLTPKGWKLLRGIGKTKAEIVYDHSLYVPISWCVDR